MKSDSGSALVVIAMIVVIMGGGAAFGQVATVAFNPASLDPEQKEKIREEKGKRDADRARESDRFHREIDEAAVGPRPALTGKDHDALGALGEASLALGRVADGLEQTASIIGLLNQKAPDAETREAGKPALIEALNQWGEATNLREEIHDQLIAAIPPGHVVTPPEYQGKLEPIPPWVPEHHKLGFDPSHNEDNPDPGHKHELGSSYAYRQAEAILTPLEKLKAAPIELDTASPVPPPINPTLTEGLLQELNRQYDGAADPNSNESLIRAAREREAQLDLEIGDHNRRVADFEQRALDYEGQRPNPPATVNNAADLAYWNGVIQANNDGLAGLRAERDRLNAEAAAQNSEADQIARRIASLSDR